MTSNSLYKLGGVCSMLLGVSYLGVGLTTLLLPPVVTYANDVQSPLMYFEANRGMVLAQYWAFLLVGVFGIAVVPAASAMVQHLDEGWVRWTSALAMLGFAVSILDNYWAIVVTPAQVAAYVSGTVVTRQVLTVPGMAQFIDVQGWLGYGAVGAWILTISLLALRSRAWPRGLAYVGVVSAVGYFVALLSQVLPGYKILTLVAAPTAIILGPIFYVWLGVVMRRPSLARQMETQFQPGS